MKKEDFEFIMATNRIKKLVDEEYVWFDLTCGIIKFVFVDDIEKVIIKGDTPYYIYRMFVKYDNNHGTLGIEKTRDISVMDCFFKHQIFEENIYNNTIRINIDSTKKDSSYYTIRSISSMVEMETFRKHLKTDISLQKLILENYPKELSVNTIIIKQIYGIKKYIDYMREHFTQE